MASFATRARSLATARQAAPVARCFFAKLCTPPTATPPLPVATYKAKPPRCFDVIAKANSHNLRLSQTERALIERDADALGNSDGKVSEVEWQALVQARAQRHAEKMLLLEYIGRVTEDGTHAGQAALRRAGLLGVIFFSITGTHAAGEAGMHVMGATLVGVVTAIGGGTLNGVMMGSTPVPWMANPLPLVATLAAGVATFYGLPLAVRVWEEATAAEASEATAAAEATTAEATASGPTAVRMGMFALESIALAAFSVVGAQSGITRGLPPVVSACLGVSIAFGGVFRDVLIQRDVALTTTHAAGNQSYGLACLAGAGTYVALREVHVRHAYRFLECGLPLTLRIACGMGAALLVRAVAWQAILEGKDMVQPMARPHDAHAEANLARLKKLWKGEG